MKYVVILCAILSFGMLFMGLYFDFQDNPIKDKLFGLGTIGLFFVTFPLFLFWRRDKMSMEKYTWKNPKRKMDEDESK